MRTVGVVAAVVLAHENVSPWQVLWWVLCGALLLVGLLLVATRLRAWVTESVAPRWDVPAVAVLAAAVWLLTWGLVAGYASVPLIG